MSKKISALTNMSGSASIDRAADFIEISDTSGGPASYKATPNFILGFTGGNPVSTSDTQSLTNKTLDNTNTITLKDTLFTLQDDGDTTKQAKFQLSGITTGTTRTYTLPNASSTLVDLSTAQTLTSKTLTSPTINTATIVNPTLTTDTVSEYTSANGVTVDGLNIKDSALNTNNSVPNNAWNNTGTFGSSWAWTTWSPTLTNLSGGTQNYAKYIQVGKTVYFRFKYTLASAGVAGLIGFTLPVNEASGYGTDDGETMNATVLFKDTGTAVFPGMVTFTTTHRIDLNAIRTDASYAFIASTSSTVPHTWASTDIIVVTGNYEAA